MRQVSIPLDKISVIDRLDSVDPDWVDALATGIEAIGLLNPITVRREGDGYVLIAGRHRLLAHVRLEREEIAATVHDVSPDEARLMEIDENLLDRKPTPLKRAVYLAERKAVYERLYPTSKKGGNRGNQHTGGRQSDTMSFSQSTAEALDLSERSIERAVRIASNIDRDLLLALDGTPVADSQKDLLKLASTSPALQQELVEALTRAEKPVKSLSAAIAEVGGHTPKKEDKTDKAYRALLDLWDRTPKAARDRFIEELRERGEL